MTPVLEGELLVVLGPVPKRCEKCKSPIKDESYRFCPVCGNDQS
jgi:pyruvate carboxylase